MSAEDTGSVNFDITATGSQFKNELNESQAAVIKFVDAAVSRFDFLANAIRGVSKGPLAAALGDFEAIGTTLDEQIHRLNAALGIYQRTSAEYRAEVARVIEYIQAQGNAFSRTMLEAQGFDDRVVATLFHLREFVGAIGDVTGDMYTLANAEREVADMAGGVVEAIEAEDKAILRLASNVQKALAEQDQAVAKNVKTVQQAEADKVKAIADAQTRATQVVAEATARRVALEEDAAAEVAAIQEKASTRAAELALGADAEAQLRGARGRSGAIRQGAIGSGLSSRIAAQIEAETEMAEATRATVRAKYDKLTNAEFQRANEEIMRLERVKNNTLEAMGTQNSLRVERIYRDTETQKQRILAEGDARIEEITRRTQAKVATLNASAATADADARKVMVARVLTLEAQLQSTVAQIRETGATKIKAIEQSKWREVNAIAEEYEQLSAGHIASYEARASAIMEAYADTEAGILESKNKVLEATEAAHQDRMLAMQTRFERARVDEARKAAQEAEALRFGGRSIVDSYSGIARFTRQFALARESGNAMMGIGGAGLAVVAGDVLASNEVNRDIYKVKGNTDMSQAEVGEVKRDVLGISTDQAIDKTAEAFMRVQNYGYKHADMMKIVSDANEGAVATFGNVDVIAKELARTLFNFNIPVSDSSKVLNALEIAAAKNDMTMEEFVEHSGRAFEAAAAMNVPFTEAAAILGTLTKAGMNAAQSQTALRSIIKGIVDPSKESAKWIAYLSEKTGVDLVHAFSASGLAKNGLIHTFDLLNKATNGHIDLLTKLFSDQRSAIPIISLLTKSHDALKDTINAESKQIIDNNRIQKNAADVKKTLTYQTGVLKNDVIKLASAYGDALAPDVQKATEWIEKILHDFRDSSQEAKTTEVRTLAVGAAFIFVSGGILKVLATLPSIVEGWKALNGLTLGLATNLKLVAPAAVEAETAVEGVAVAEETAFALTPVGLFVTALAGVALAVYGIKKAWDSANDAQDAYYKRTHHGHDAPVERPDINAYNDYKTHLNKSNEYSQDQIDNYQNAINRIKNTLGLYVNPKAKNFDDLVTDERTEGTLAGSQAISFLQDKIDSFQASINENNADLFGDDDLTNTRKNVKYQITKIQGTIKDIKAEMAKLSTGPNAILNGFLGPGNYAPGSNLANLQASLTAQTHNLHLQQKSLDALPERSVGQMIAAVSQSMQSIANKYHDLCERLVADTVEKATGHASIDGVNLRQSAIDVLNEAQAKGVGMPYEKGMALHPGDILLSSHMGVRNGVTYGHAGIMGQNGFELDDMGQHAQDAFPWDWVIRAGAKSALPDWAKPGRFKIPPSDDKLPGKPGSTSTGRGTEALPIMHHVPGINPKDFQGVLSGELAQTLTKSPDDIAKLAVDIHNYTAVLAAIKEVGANKLANPDLTPLKEIEAKIDTAKQLQTFYTDSSKMLKSAALEQHEHALKLNKDLDDTAAQITRANRAWIDAAAAKKKFEDAHTKKLTEDEKKELRSLTEAVTNAHHEYSQLVDKHANLITQLRQTSKQFKNDTRDANSYANALLQVTDSLDNLNRSQQRLELQTPSGQLQELKNNEKAGFYTHSQYQDRLKALMGSIANEAGLTDTDGVDPKTVLSRLESGTDDMKASVKDYQAVLDEYVRDIERTAKATATQTKIIEEAFDKTLTDAIKNAANELKDGSISWQDYVDISDTAARKAAESAQAILRAMDPNTLTESQKALLNADTNGKSAMDLNPLITGSGIEPMVRAWTQAYSQIQAQTDKHTAAQRKAAKDYYVIWNESAKLVSGALNSEIDNIIKKHESFGKAVTGIWTKLKENITKKVIDDQTKKMFDWVGNRVKPNNNGQTDDTKKKAQDIIDTIKPLNDQTLAAQSALLDKTVAVANDAANSATSAQITLASTQTLFQTTVNWLNSFLAQARNPSGQVMATPNVPMSLGLPGATSAGAQGGANVWSMTTTQLAQWLKGGQDQQKFSQVGGGVASLTSNLQSLAHIAPGKGFMDPGSKAVNIGEVGQLGSDVASVASGGNGLTAGADALGTLGKMGVLSKMGGFGASVSAALPWVEAAIAVASIFDALGKQSKPDVVQKIGDTKYNALVGTDFSSIASKGLEGPDGMRALLGGYASQQAAAEAIARSGGGASRPTGPQVVMHEGAVKVIVQGVDPSNARQVADLVYNHINDKLTTDAQIHNATTGTTA